MSVNIFEDGELKRIAGNAQGNDISDSTVNFTSGDSLNPTAPTNVDLIKSGETLKGLINKFSIMIKNTRYLLKMLGTTDISALADGTVTGSVKAAMERAEKSPLYIGTHKDYSTPITNGTFYHNTPAPFESLSNIRGFGFYYTAAYDDIFNVAIQNIDYFILYLNGGVEANSNHIVSMNVIDVADQRSVMICNAFYHYVSRTSGGWVRATERSLPLVKGKQYWIFVQVITVETWTIRDLLETMPMTNLLLSVIS